MKIIIGLGNPGKQYDNTRHNLGFMVLDALAKELDLKWQANKKFQSEVAKGVDQILVKPQTFMNNSGQAVAAILSYYKLTPADLTVIHDDLDIELGKYKTSIDSRSAGHRGVESIIDHLKTKDFKRIRIGIKTPVLEKIPVDKFVMQKFNKVEKKIINPIITKVIKEL